MTDHICTFENCNKVFSRPYKLQNHYNLHLGVKSFKCSETNCSKSYSSSSHLQRHVKHHHHSDQPKKKIFYACAYENCNSTFETLWGLQRHENNHQSPYHCQKCNVYFKTSTSLDKHTKRHIAVSQRKCQYCGEDFGGKMKRDLLRHEEKHTHVVCEICNKTFRTLTSLQRHLVTHESQFECAYCGLILRRKNLIKTHIYKLHCGFITPSICEENGCSGVFLYKRNYTKHRLLHHEEAQYKCPVADCCQKFLHKKSYHHHLNLHQQNRVKLKEKRKKIDVAEKLISIICP